MSAFGDIGSSDPLQIWDGVAGWTAGGDRVTLALIELEPDSVVPEHSHENEQVGILLKGSMTFRIGGEARDLTAGATWSIPSGTPHDVRTGPDGATLVEVFAPGRTDWSGLDRIAARRPLWPPLP
jgi:quercetin dioxygenase-like cupin family protein